MTAPYDACATLLLRARQHVSMIGRQIINGRPNVPVPRRPTRARLLAYARLMRLHRPIGILLLLWPMLWALWLAAGGWPDPWILGVFVAGTVLMRAAGCVINDYADRDFDGHVARTRDRPLATGAATPREALVLFGVLVACAGLLVLRPTA